MRSRGFNQSSWIAHALRKEIGAGTEGVELLERKRDTPTQTRLDRWARKANVKNAFALKPGTSFNGETPVVLIDDVFTTGATLDSCAQVLLEEGFDQLGINEPIGDVNQDSVSDVVDIIIVINHILNIQSLSNIGEYLADINQNSTINILDVILLINIILDA